jgi:pimeloyl-ACP methyl ester carboxylesterase
MMKTSRRHRIMRRILFTFMGVVLLGFLAIFVLIRVTFSTEEDAMGAIQKTVTSKDGTAIAYEQSGGGPVVILVSAALTDRSGNRRLARELSRSFTVINYDRRGRGKSGDQQPYSTDREVEDISALIDACGGSAYLFGSSSGSVLALDAASRLSSKVKKLYMYEPPFIVDSSRPPMPVALSSDINRQVASGSRSDAVRMFFNKGMGIPSAAVTLMRFLMPGWSKMCGMAHTIAYDLAILDDTQSGQPLPQERWRGVANPVRVAVGGRSETFFHNGAKALAQLLPSANYQSLAGLNHGALLLSAASLAKDVRDFFLQI